MDGTTSAQPLSIRLLVIDDDDVDRERVLRLLARTPLQVEAKQADSSSSALELLREEVFDCIMLDNQLGGDNGADLLPTIQRESLRPCPVIMITGAGNESLAVRALQQGAADYLTKYQLNGDLLARSIRRAMDHQRLRDEVEELHQRLEQRVEEQALAIRQNERDLRAILDHTPTAIGYWQSDLRARFGNRAFRHWLGVDPETLPGRSLREVIGPTRMARTQRHVDGVLKGHNQSFELSDVGPDGMTRRHAQISFHADVDDHGRTRGFYSTINDVTEIKQAQARAEELALFAETLFEHSPVGLAVFDERLCCSKFNRALARLIGTEGPELAGASLRTWSGDDLQPLQATAFSTLADGLPRHLEVDVVTTFGTHLQATCAWARVEHNTRGQLLLAVQDDTEQRRTLDALVKARNNAEKATRSKSEFLANMSHEIRTPMNAIIGMTRIALEDELPPRTRAFIDKAHAAALALMGLLDDVLDYSRIEAGRLKLEQVPMDIESVLQRVLDLFALRIEQKGLGLVVEIAPGVPRWVLGDPLRLGQVLNNLVGNAVKFTERGRISISVRPADDASPDPALLQFVVRDSGIGIAQEHQHALFEAFAQADGSITRRFGGSGLGLSICRHLVARMHGTLGVTSTPGQGSEFWFNTRLEPTLPTPGEELTVDDGTDAVSVLFVEPDPQAAAALGWSLRARRMTGVGVTDPKAAEEAWAEAASDAQGFDAVLLDWKTQAGMPDVDPAVEQLIDRIRRGTVGVPPPVILGMVAHAGGARSAGPPRPTTPDALLSKPVLPSALRKAVLRVRSQRTNLASGTPDGGGSTAPPPQPLSGVRVLLVEDNPINQEVARLTLERLGARITLAGDGAEALDRLHPQVRADFDVVLMDMQMPRMDGLEATRRIRADPHTARLPVIGMTAAAMPEDRQRCLQAGMDDCLVKPVVAERLLDALLRWTGHRTDVTPAAPTHVTRTTVGDPH